MANNFDFGPLLVNNQANSGGNDSIFFTPNATASSAGTLSLLMVGSSAATDLGNLNDFTITALRTTGTGNFGSSRAVIRIGSDYYVGGSNGNNLTGAYAQSSLDTSSWFNYDPGTSISTIGSAAALNATDQVDAVGFLLTRGVNSTNTNVNARLWIGQFEATAVPEPSSIALIGLGLAGLLARRRRS